MHVDASKLQNNSIIEGDICIIGAGAAGISMALEWVNTPHKVILLEGGGFQVESEIQDLYRGKNTGLRYFPLQSARLHYFGGTTGHWAGFCSTYDPIDFKKRAWVPHSGWPIARADLDAFYPRAQPLLELGPYEYDFSYWKEKDEALSPFPFDENVIWNKVWQFSPPTRFGTKYRDQIVNAKNIHLYTYANVTNITTNEAVKQVQQVTVKNLQGKQHTVKAKLFVMACCSIQNARLLLASNQQAPKGLGNNNDLVGRYFMEHLEINSAHLYLAKTDALKAYRWESFVTKMRAELAIHEKKQEELQLLNGTCSLWPYMGKEPEAFINTFSDKADVKIKEWEENEKAFLEGKKGKSSLAPFKHYTLFTRMEQAPNPNSRITLDTEKDALGMPRVSLHWQLTPLEKKSTRKLYDLIGQQMGIAGLGRVKLLDWLEDEKNTQWPDTTGGGWHHMGTTRMHDNPKEGVVDANCKVHGINNLFIAGASCFTTAGTANPTLTLVALTLRLSDHLKNQIGSKNKLV
jgi:choline dehydrogenase-like flavoprotein